MINSIQYDTNKQLKNKEFLIINSILAANNWELIHNEINHISYCKFGDETTTFDIKINQHFTFRKNWEFRRVKARK